MSAEVVAVLAVLDGADPGGLGKQGAFWSMPPIAYNSETCGYPEHHGWREHDDVRWHCYMCQHPARALVLWWDGELVPEGWDRFVRALLPSDGRDDRPVSRFPTLDQVISATGAAMPNMVDRAVCLARVGGRLVEVSS